MRFPHITRRHVSNDDDEDLKKEENKPLPSLYEEETDEVKTTDDETEFDVPAFLRRRQR